MAQRRVNIQLLVDLLQACGWPKENIVPSVKEVLVMELLRQDRVPEPDAARFLGLTRREFLKTMGRF